MEPGGVGAREEEREGSSKRAQERGEVGVVVVGEIRVRGRGSGRGSAGGRWSERARESEEGGGEKMEGVWGFGGE